MGLNLLCKSGCVAEYRQKIVDRLIGLDRMRVSIRIMLTASGSSQGNLIRVLCRPQLLKRQ